MSGRLPENSIKYVLRDGIIEWRLPNGKRHRDDGPAIIFPDGVQYWYQHGLCHRLDGPAVIWKDDEVEDWWVNDIPISFQVQNWIADNVLPSWKEWDDDIWVLFRIRFS